MLEVAAVDVRDKALREPGVPGLYTYHGHENSSPERLLHVGSMSIDTAGDGSRSI
jgi:hypothetical protein